MRWALCDVEVSLVDWSPNCVILSWISTRRALSIESAWVSIRSALAYERLVNLEPKQDCLFVAFKIGEKPVDLFAVEGPFEGSKS